MKAHFNVVLFVLMIVSIVLVFSAKQSGADTTQTHHPNKHCNQNQTCAAEDDCDGVYDLDCDSACEHQFTQGACVVPLGQEPPPNGCCQFYNPDGCGDMLLADCEKVGSVWQCVYEAIGTCQRTWCQNGNCPPV